MARASLLAVQARPPQENGRPPRLSLATLASSPDRVADVPPGDVPALLAALAALQSALAARLLSVPPASAEAPTSDRLLTVSEACARLSCSRTWLYRNAADLPFVVRQGRTLRCSEAGIARYIAARGNGTDR